MFQFKDFKIHAIRWELNTRADVLQKGVACGEYSKKNELILKEDSTGEKEEEKLHKVNMVDVSEEFDEECCWMKEIVDFLQNSVLPEDKIKARRIRIKATIFIIVKGVLFRKSFSGPLLRCMTKSKANEVLNTIHSRVCGNHSVGRSLAHKAITFGYFWPYMMQDEKNFAKKCEKYHKHAPLIHQHLEPCHSIVIY